MKNIILIILIASCYSLDSFKWYSVILDEQIYKVVEGKKIDGSLAWGYYAEEIHKDGWGKLTLETNSFQRNEEAYAAGYLEGAL